AHCCICVFFFFQAEDGIRDRNVTGVQTCALPIWAREEGRYFGHEELFRGFLVCLFLWDDDTVDVSFPRVRQINAHAGSRWRKEMFRTWKDTILSHYSLISGKGLKNEKHRFIPWSQPSSL